MTDPADAVPGPLILTEVTHVTIRDEPTGVVLYDEDTTDSGGPYPARIDWDGKGRFTLTLDVPPTEGQG